MDWTYQIKNCELSLKGINMKNIKTFKESVFIEETKIQELNGWGSLALGIAIGALLVF